MDAVIVQNVRCFQWPMVVPLKPLTILVGENSSGKSAFLSAVRIAWDLGNAIETPSFNQSPFRWGSYREIAHYKGGLRSHRAEHFEIGFRAKVPQNLTQHLAVKPNEYLAIGGSFVARGSRPFLQNWHAKLGPFSIRFEFTRTEDSLDAIATIKSPNGSEKRSIENFGKVPMLLAADVAVHALKTNGAPKRSGTNGSDAAIQEDIERFSKVLHRMRRLIPSRPLAIAPVRSRPKRTYEVSDVAPHPRGGHVPMILAEIHRGKENWPSFHKALKEAEDLTGLFYDLEIKDLGKSSSSPFQIVVSTGQRDSNVADVGYGVSQVLPIIVDILLAKEGQMFLIQEPEVHLHPRAQAGLGTFFGRIASKQNKRFIIETHSDYLVDRVRMDVRDGKGLQSEDVGILYFEPGDRSTKIHPMTIDEAGNLLGAPPSYRRFILDEQRRFVFPKT